MGVPIPIMSSMARPCQARCSGAPDSGRAWLSNRRAPGCGAAGIWRHREEQAAGVPPGTLPRCTHCTFSRKVCSTSPTLKAKDPSGTSSSLSTSSPLQAKHKD